VQISFEMLVVIILFKSVFSNPCCSKSVFVEFSSCLGGKLEEKTFWPNVTKKENGHTRRKMKYVLLWSVVEEASETLEGIQ